VGHKFIIGAKKAKGETRLTELNWVRVFPPCRVGGPLHVITQWAGRSQRLPPLPELPPRHPPGTKGPQTTRDKSKQASANTSHGGPPWNPKQPNPGKQPREESTRGKRGEEQEWWKLGMCSELDGLKYFRTLLRCQVTPFSLWGIFGGRLVTCVNCRLFESRSLS
jgi:hypothetical protein